MATTSSVSRKDMFNIFPEELLLITDSKHPRYDPRVNLPLNEGLVRSIMYMGVKEPVLVAKIDGKAEVIAGRQRVKAALEANKRLAEQGKEPMRVRCVFERGEDADLFGIAVTENENREDDSPLGKAKNMQRLLDFGKSEEEVSVIFGLSMQSVKNNLKLLDLSAAVRHAVEKSEIAASAAAKLSGLEREEQEKALEKLLKEANGKRPTARKVAKLTTNGKEGHRMLTAKQIEAELEKSLLIVESGDESKKDFFRGYAAALQLVLNKEEQD